MEAGQPLLIRALNLTGELGHVTAVRRPLSEPAPSCGDARADRVLCLGARGRSGRTCWQASWIDGARRSGGRWRL